jgi:predicted metal-dependent phosphoesterase TrpH
MIKLKKLGVDGVEVLSPHHSFGSVMYAQAMTKELDFISSGGSDFHRHERDHYLIQNSSAYFTIDSKYLKGVNKIIG